MSDKRKGWKEHPFTFGNGIPFDDDIEDERKDTERFLANKEEIGFGCYRTLFDPDEAAEH